LHLFPVLWCCRFTEALSKRSAPSFHATGYNDFARSINNSIGGFICGGGGHLTDLFNWDLFMLPRRGRKPPTHLLCTECDVGTFGEDYLAWGGDFRFPLGTHLSVEKLRASSGGHFVGFSLKLDVIGRGFNLSGG
jgi:hypothetical protein